ncbi:hypothetical protein GETHPA_09080 [Geothrix rubra]|uniref:J domain-containing protein n=1 Tax=Geothrix rubra TaxID=2927977 RepID=A0ABQ5Q4N5_9BACT|nr:hypothetical protein [Geothrix rubra]GLH69375.1 hypothetical protein GETHPA_09080 [Geothrix rubra]
MRDLYRALGLDGAGARVDRVISRLEEVGLSRDLVEDVRFVLLDPARKARYDELLRVGRGLAEVRAGLGLPPDPLLPGVKAPRRWPNRRPGMSPGQGDLLLRVGAIGAGGLVLLVALAWPQARPGGRRADRGTPLAAGPGPGTESRPRGGSSPIVAGEGPPSLPTPEHGALQIEPGVHPCVPWRIETDPGRDYFLSLVDARSQVAVLTLYLCGGVSYQGLAPEGSFRLVYASGSGWLGPRRGFALEAKSVNAPQIFRIQAGPDDTWTWSLCLHASGSEGSPVAPLDGPDDPPPSLRP